MVEPKVSLKFERVTTTTAVELIGSLPVGACANVRVSPPQIGGLEKWFTVAVEHLNPEAAKELAGVLVQHRRRLAAESAGSGPDHSPGAADVLPGITCNEPGHCDQGGQA